MAMWMPSRCPKFQYLVLMLVLPLVFGGKTPYCIPEKQMYLDGRCVDCPECVPGQALNKTKKIETDMFGSMECYPCEECPAGTYSNERRKDFFDGYKCYTHKDCGKRGRVVKIPGTNRTNNICGKCLEGYISEDWPILDKNSYCYPCSAKDKEKSVCRDFIPTTTPSTTQHPSKTSSTTTVISRSATKNQDPNISIMILFGLVIGVVLGIILISLTWCICQQTNGDKQQAILDSEKVPLADVESDGPFSSVSTGISSRTTTTDASEDRKCPIDELVEVSEDRKCPTDESLDVSEDRKCPTDESLNVSEDWKCPTDESLDVSEDRKCPTDESLDVSEDRKRPTDESLDVSEDRKRLNDEEIYIASTIRLQNDDCYVQGVGNAAMVSDEKNIKNLARSLGLPETQIDELIENRDGHLIAYLNKFIQRNGKTATLSVLYNALVKHAAEPELKALVEIFRKSVSKPLISEHTKNSGESASGQITNKDPGALLTGCDGVISYHILEH